MAAKKLLRVAVIGAGPSGLSACRHLAASSYEFVCFEQCSSVGGAWYYSDDNIDYDDENNKKKNDAASTAVSHYQSPMYKNLRTNSPPEVFVFPDFPFRQEINNNDELQSFVTHTQMLEYLRAYAKHFNLMPYIRLNTSVQKVRRVKNAGSTLQTQFSVSAIDTLTGAPFEDENFDAVMVCIGHYIKPKWPVVKNLDKFGGKLMHSKFYRHPKQFPVSCKKILVMGGGYSGIDVAIDLDRNSATKKQVILCGRNLSYLGDLQKWNESCDIGLKPDITEVIGSNKVKFADKTIESEVGAILMATGYYYDFPFFSAEDGLALLVDDQRLTPLYKHMIHINFPNLCFIGMTWAGLTIPQFDQQVKYFIAMLNEQFHLPPRAQMLEWVERDISRRLNEYKWPQRYAHRMGRQVQRDYMASLCEESGISALDEKIFAIDDEVGDLRLKDPLNFKLHNCEWLKDKS